VDRPAADTFRVTNEVISVWATGRTLTAAPRSAFGDEELRMSIYATLAILRIPLWPSRPVMSESWPEHWVELVVQGVPGHIGHPRHYEEDLYADFLPPPVEDEEALRAVVIVEAGTPKGTPRSYQEYENPLMVLTGEEWNTTPFPELWGRFDEVVNERHQNE
jgi:hypothetical protein